MCIYRKAFVLIPISNQLNIEGCNLIFTMSLNASDFEMDG